MKKLLALILTAALLVTLLTGCGAGTETTAPTELPAGESEDAPAEEVDVLETAMTLLKEKSAAYPSDAVYMTVNGEEFDWDMFYSRIAGLIYSYVYSFGEIPTDFTTDLGDGEQLGAYIIESGNTFLRTYGAVMSHAEAEGYALDAEEEAEIEKTFAEAVENNGGEEAFEEALRDNFLTTDIYRFTLHVSRLYRKMREQCSAKITQEDADAWAEENGQVCCKHILLMNTAADGSALDEAALAERKQQLEELREELLAITDPDERRARFDELIAEFNEDPGEAGYPDGYVFGTGEMVKEFEEAAFALEDYALSEIVETSYGFHLLLRLPITPDTMVDYDSSSYEPLTLRDTIALDRCDETIYNWSESAEVVIDPKFENFSLTELFA